MLTYCQIAAKKAKAEKAAKNGRSALTEEEIEEDEDDALLTTLAPGGEIAGREAHHTEAQIVRFPCSTFDRWNKESNVYRLRRKPRLRRVGEVLKSVKHTTLVRSLLFLS
jgi:hypothetical protein